MLTSQTRRAVLLLCLLFAFMTCNNARSADNESIAVMSYNIRLNTASDKDDAWPHRATKVIETLKQADTAGLQEVLKNQLDDLVAGLPDYDFVGAGRDDGKEKGEFVPIFYKRERFDKGDSGNFWLSETPEVPGSKSWDTAITRMVTWVVLKDKQTAKSFLHMNTHFDHMGKRARLESAKLIKRRAAELYPDMPLIVSGDFNCNPDSPPYKAMVSSEEVGELFVDSLAGYSPKDDEPVGTWNAFKAIEPNRIDFIFTARDAQSKDARILDPRTDAGRFASDHLPVVATVIFTKQ